MVNANLRVPQPLNEPVKAYAPGSPERAELKAALARLGGERPEIPVRIGSAELRTGRVETIRAPHRHAQVLGTFHEAGADEARQAIDAALAAKPAWSAMPFGDRTAIFLRAAELLTTKYRPLLNAATMLGQSKTAHQAEIDAACEAIDFLRFNVHFAQTLLDQQPLSAPGMWNQTDYRPLDGFVFAVTPFNFTAIALNLCAAPALMGNVVVFKPAQSAVLSAHWIMQLLREAGLPDGVITMLPGPGPAIGGVALTHPDLGGLHFTGSTNTFNHMWRTVGENVSRYRQYPRLVGETGGKDFIFVHPSAAGDLDAVATAIVRGGFEFQGQKCSACSRVFVPRSLWRGLLDRLVPMTEALRMGDVADFRNFMGAVIDERSFANVSKYLELARGPDATVLAGGTADRGEGWFVRPTLVECSTPRHQLMVEEIFAPIVSLVTYPDDEYLPALRACDAASPYALTGAVFARDRRAIATASHELRHAAGNFYVNDKPTGAVVGQQPFGGSRASGTNDKAGSLLNLLRWTSPRTIKETFAPPTTVEYPFMGAE
ncbi:MAG: L-glutamate gamma-semialdehyde dehydrogenase [Myxococcaceae bacterium]|jgi:1-pyrroline-5-carboxylate dehydrogenase|nr:L-glutamate gamma-semialdehyde dehydrogenase [Myxococcaceae bacterium]